MGSGTGAGGRMQAAEGVQERVGGGDEVGECLGRGTGDCVSDSRVDVPRKETQ